MAPNTGERYFANKIITLTLEYGHYTKSPYEWEITKSLTRSHSNELKNVVI